MLINFNKEKLHEAQMNWYSWRNNASTITMICLSLVMACFTGVMAQVSIAIPWSPVLITLQTFAVLVTGVFLGSKYGGLSMILYAVLGACGMPWFTNMNSGLSFLFASSGGYIIGFIFASIFIGYVFDHYVSLRKPIQTVIAMFIANFICIYIPGLIVLAYSTQAITTQAVSLPELFIMGVAPFIVGDIIKIALASAITTSVLPKE